MVPCVRHHVADCEREPWEERQANPARRVFTIRERQANKRKQGEVDTREPAPVESTDKGTEMIKFAVGRVLNNSSQIVRQINRRKRELLNEFGQDVHDIAKQSMKHVPLDSKKTSSPGSPPFVRSGEPNLTTIRHAVDGDSVIVGPVLSNQSSNVGSPTPGVLEHGGIVTKKVNRGRLGQGRLVRYRVKARPFVYPAGMKALQRLHANVRRKGIAR